jgi:hypothetical protein
MSSWSGTLPPCQTGRALVVRPFFVFPISFRLKTKCDGFARYLLLTACGRFRNVLLIKGRPVRRGEQVEGSTTRSLFLILRHILRLTTQARQNIA